MILLERNDARMVRLMCNVGPHWISTVKLRVQLQLNNMRECSQNKIFIYVVIQKAWKRVTGFVNVKRLKLLVV